MAHSMTINQNETFKCIEQLERALKVLQKNEDFPTPVLDKMLEQTKARLLGLTTTAFYQYK